MKLIIDIPEEVFNTIKSFKGKFICENGYDLIQGVKNGIPFDTVIEDIKAEISEPIQGNCYFIGQAKVQAETIKWCLEIVDKYTSGKEFSFPEREKGEWISVVDHEDEIIKENHWECSKCGSSKSGWGEYKFCPNCGADMRGGKE